MLSITVPVIVSRIVGLAPNSPLGRSIKVRLKVSSFSRAIPSGLKFILTGNLCTGNASGQLMMRRVVITSTSEETASKMGRFSYFFLS